MRAAAIAKFGPPSVLRTIDVPAPSIGPRDVLIAVHAAGVGGWDASTRSGEWAERRQRFPLVLGSDGAGVVAAVGARVRRFRVGQRVFAFAYQNPKGGFYAEYAAVPADLVAPIPRRLDMRQAGAAAATGITALQGIDDVLRIRRGERVLIFGGTGAVGTLAIQFAKRRGAHVMSTATGRAAQQLVRRLGAEAVLDARSARALAQLDAWAPDGVDAVLALAGGQVLDAYLDRVRPGGRVAYPNGVAPAPPRRRGYRLRAYDGVASRPAFARLLRAIDEAKLRVPIAATYPLAQAAKAHQRVEKGHVLGRIVLRVG